MVAIAQKCMKTQFFCSDIGTGTRTPAKVYLHVGEFRDTLTHTCQVKSFEKSINMANRVKSGEVVKVKKVIASEIKWA